MELSIIIALYNTEAYIEKCIRSIYSENGLSYDAFEIIVINDGSTDNSQSIVEKLQKDFSNLILINKDNGGQSSARNMGFKVAKGKYIFCLDSDDSLDPDELLKALEYCNNNDLDMLPIFYHSFNENFELIAQKKDTYEVQDNVINGGEFLYRYVISGSMWRYFYRTSILRKYNLFLTEGIFHEDEEFVIKFLSYTKRITYRKHLVYNHLVRGDSTVNKRDKKHRLKLLNDITTVIDHLKQHLDNFDKGSLQYIGITKKIEQLCVSLFLRMKNDDLHFDEIKYFVDKLTTLELYPLKIENLDFKFRIAARFFNSNLCNKLYFR